MDSIKNAASAVGDKVGELTGASKAEANKQVAQDSNQDLSTRAKAGLDYIGNKADEKKNEASKEANKEAAKH